MGREVLGREKTFPSTEWKFKVIDEYIDTDSSHTRIYEGRSEINASYLFPWKLH